MRDARSLLDVLNDIFGNLQDIVHSEIHLVKAEVTHELHSAKATAVGLGVALLASAFCVLFLLLAAMYALTLVLTAWASALVVAGAMALVGVVAFVISARRARERRTTGRTKENLAWAEQSTK